MPKVLLTDYAWPDLDIERQILSAATIELVVAPAKDTATLANLARDVDAIMTNWAQVPASVLEAAPKCRIVARLGIGLDNIDVATATRLKMLVTNVPDYCLIEVAEHALAMLLGLLNRVPSSMEEIREGKWIRDANRGIELTGKTVGIIGYGNTGGAFAKLLSIFDVTVLAYDKYKFGFGRGYVKEASLEQVCRYADVISLHIPLTSETMHFANEEFFKSLQQKPYFLNTSRGKIVQIPAIINALKQQQISGAGLDVLENEKLDTYSLEEKQQLKWLLDQANVIITPHIAGYSNEAFLKMGKVLLEKLGI